MTIVKNIFQVIKHARYVHSTLDSMQLESRSFCPPAVFGSVAPTVYPLSWVLRSVNRVMTSWACAKIQAYGKNMSRKSIFPSKILELLRVTASRGGIMPSPSTHWQIIARKTYVTDKSLLNLEPLKLKKLRYDMMYYFQIHNLYTRVASSRAISF